MQSSIEQLKSRLLSCLDEEHNVTDMSGAVAVLNSIENAAVTKETLENTRLGLVVNEIRKKCAQTYPEISKKCRFLIKEWQKLVPTSTTAAGGQGSNNGSPAATNGGGSLTTPRAAKLASAGLTCSPSPSLRTLGGKVVTPKVAAVVNGDARCNGSPKISSPSSRSSALPLSNSYAPPCTKSTTTASTVAPSPLVLYSTSAAGSINNGLLSEATKPQSPALNSLKIRIKVGGGSESASIVRSTDAGEAATFSGEAAKNTGEAAKSYAAAFVKCESVEVKLNGTSDNGTSNCISTGPVSMLPVVSVVETAAEMVVTPADVVRRGRRPKRRLDAADASDPLFMISKGGSLPKQKSTAALVAEMAREYPEEMAKSITASTLDVSPATPDDEDEAITLAVGEGGKRALALRRTNAADVDGDYLEVSKSELVAQYLKSSVGEDDDDDDDYCEEDYRPPPSSSTSPPPPYVSHMGDLPQVRRRGRPRKYPAAGGEFRIFSSVATPAPPPSAKRMKDKQAAAPTQRRETPTPPVVKQQQQQHPQIPAMPKVRRDVNWYDVLPPLKLDQEEVAKEEKVEKIVAAAAKYLDDYWPTDKLDSAAAASEVGELVPSLHSRILSSIGERSVLAMPYVDIGLPDFVQYRYPDSERYVAHWSER